MRERSGLSQQQVADSIGVSKGMISFYERGVNEPEKDKLISLAKLFKVDYSTLYDDGKTLNEPIESYHKKGIPIFNKDFTAGDITQFADEPQRVVGHIDLNGFRQCVGFVPVKGSSMYPDFVAGDLIGLEPIGDFSIVEFGQPFAIVTKNNQRMIKIIRKGKDDENLVLRSTNKEFDDINIHRSKIQALFKVHGPVRDQWQ